MADDEATDKLADSVKTQLDLVAEGNTRAQHGASMGVHISEQPSSMPLINRQEHCVNDRPTRKTVQL